MTPKAFLFVDRNPNKSASELEKIMKIGQGRFGTYANRANRSKHSVVTGEKIINAGDGYILKSKALPHEKMETTKMRMTLALNVLTNDTTKDVACEAQIEATTLYLECMPKLLEGMANAVKELTSLPSKEKQIEILEYKLKQLKGE